VLTSISNGCQQSVETTAADLREALTSFSLRATEEQAKKLFALYDRRAKGTLPLQTLIETVLDSAALPLPLTRADREAIVRQVCTL
jgi:hypothetical protein